MKDPQIKRILSSAWLVDALASSPLFFFSPGGDLPASSGPQRVLRNFVKIETALLLCVSFLSSEGPFDSFEEWGQVFILDAPSQRLGMDSERLCEETCRPSNGCG